MAKYIEFLIKKPPRVITVNVNTEYIAAIEKDGKKVIIKMACGDGNSSLVYTVDEGDIDYEAIKKLVQE